MIILIRDTKHVLTVRKNSGIFFLNNEIGGRVGGGGIEHTVVRGGLH
jgi:hypothetical protein